MYKRLFLVLLVISLGCAVTLAGCGSDSTETTQPSTAQPSTAQPSTAQPSTTGLSATETSTTEAATTEPVRGGTLTILTDIDGSGVVGCPWEQNVSNASVTFPCVDRLITWYFGVGPKPNLAKSWEVAADGKSITFQLRDDVSFHDGTKFDAAALKWNMDKWKEGNQGGTAFWVSTEVVDTYTLRLNITQYNSTILSSLAEDYLGPISPTAYEKNGEEWAQKNPVGTGPYKLVSLEVGSGWKYEKNADYWGGEPYLDAIEYKTINDWNTMKLMMESGEADMVAAGGAAGAKVISALLDEGFEPMSYKSGGDPSCIYPDSANADSPLSNKDVRLAIDYALDKEAIASLGMGLWDPVSQLASPASDYFDASLVRGYDVTKAKELLAGAGYAEGFKCSVYYEPGTPTDIVVAVQSMLAEVGIELTLEPLTQPAAFELAMGGWQNGFFSMPFSVYEDFTSGVSLRFSKNSPLFPSLLRSDALEELISKAASAQDAAEAHGYYGQISKYIFDEALCIPLFSYARGALGAKASYVHDEGYGIHSAATWTPALCWKSK